jgi:hypothetical protein
MAETILDMILTRVDGATRDKLSEHLNLPADEAQGGLKAAVPLLLGAMERNTSSAEGALSLNRALERDHDGSVLEQLPQLLDNPQQGHGAGILKHVLGKRRDGVEERLAEKTGMQQGSIAKLLELAAPLVLGALGKQRKEQGLGATQMSQYISREREQTENGAGWLGMATELLDADDDGSVLDDISGLLGNILGRKK